MACSTNTYFHSLEQSLKEYIDYGLIKELMHVRLVFIYFIRSNHSLTQMITQLLIQNNNDIVLSYFSNNNLTIKKFYQLTKQNVIILKILQ